VPLAGGVLRRALPSELGHQAGTERGKVCRRVEIARHVWIVKVQPAPLRLSASQQIAQRA
jgi:hypothetical protein